VSARDEWCKKLGLTLIARTLVGARGGWQLTRTLKTLIEFDLLGSLAWSWRLCPGTLEAARQIHNKLVLGSFLGLGREDLISGCLILQRVESVRTRTQQGGSSLWSPSFFVMLPS
jgi:hypothetical protein